jgi:hypothetical protein
MITRANKQSISFALRALFVDQSKSIHRIINRLYLKLTDRARFHFTVHFDVDEDLARDKVVKKFSQFGAAYTSS